MTVPTNPGDDDLRQALHDAVADVRPHGTYDDIRSRTTEETPMKRWFVPTLAVAAVMAAVLAGGVWLLSDDGEKLSPAGTPTTGTSTGATDPSESPGGLEERAVPAYFVGETAHGKKLYREFQRKSVCAETECLLKAAMVTALTGRPGDPDYRSPWPEGTTVGAVSYDGDTIVVHLADGVQERPSGMSAADADLAIQQAVFTAQAAVGQGRVPVQLVVEGGSGRVLGVAASEPFAADNPDEVLAPVQVDSPTDGTTVSSHFTVTGRAATFEANVVWELKQGATVVKHGFTTAQECCTLSPYEFDVTAPAGTYTLTVHDTDESGEDRPVNEDTKEITVK